MTEHISRVVRDLRRGLAGAVLAPGSGGYDEGRRAVDPAFESRPAAIAEALGAADVRAALLTAREHGLPFAVQATGHGTRVACDGGVLVKTSAMTGVLVDPERRVARVAPGTRWGAVLAAAAPFGLAPLSGSSPDVGVVGYTLGGGLGWLARSYGFAADSVLRAEVVTAGGERVVTDAGSHPELFWALRGGGGNFGVVTSLEFRLYPVARVFAGTAYFPVGRAAAALARYREWIGQAPDELSTAVLVTRMPGHAGIPGPLRGERALAVKAMHTGSPAAARRALAPLLAAAGPALLDDMRPMPYARTAMGGLPARHMDLVTSLPDLVIDAIVDAAGRPDSAVGTVEVRHWGGAIARPGAGAGPVSHRRAALSVIADGVPPALVAALRPCATGGTFLNFLGDASRTASAYTAGDLRRLREVKRAYDPANVFRVNHNIAPAPAGSVCVPA
ncbi:FAD-dependent oxidoreductase [Spongiactinospora sp. TRM90649]|uniref:FAD-binding oxidoreductase n=1 Tax=Spongiactinospora sp. TRM90649 TaxID=3031114 RepID=UPI0023F94815|nr:FAD-dependent oxidoreductase [Spongiactinospora sp. TRM90649]MDF5759377.1 FAD-binding protein [Spongiactinospora sp. TRM90649]